ncbi:3-hydroxyacyl-CoA dehydrogenase NAD-binding domain-containing protein [Marinibacterium sp. SX1]|uniref:3-hydroxyacyl-CoA dehydrogenase NAD-binding domain-containing protein n=1 Tax=Marinibacterium sp. SX1 TaxID=3388424 RepID=UPI003D180E2C
MPQATCQVTYETAGDGIAILSLAGPDGGPAAPGPALWAELGRAVDRLAGDDAVQGAILRAGEGPDLLAAPDTAALLDRIDTGGPVLALAETIRAEAAVLRRLETCGKPVVALLHGRATGPAWELALACHHRLALAGPGARFGLPDIALGCLPALGGSQRLPRLAGIEAAVPLLLDGRLLADDAALQLGLLDGLAGDGPALVDMARAWLTGDTPDKAVRPWDIRGYRLPGGAGPLAPFAGEVFQANTSRLKAGRSRYPAPHALLTAVYEGTLLPIDRALQVEADLAAQVLCDPVAGNLLRSARTQAAARRPVALPAGAVAPDRLGVLGAGMMGAGIANVAAGAGLDVVLLDRSMDAAERGLAHVRAQGDRAVSRGQASRAEADALAARVRPTADPADLAGCGLIIEAVFENRAVKAQAMAAAEPMLAKGGVMASNTSTLPITGLARTLADPARFIGLHFFSPVERMPLVEVITGSATSPATLAEALAFVTRLGKVPITVRDSPGFYTSRVFCSYIDEAMAMLAEGIAPALIENAARQAGFPMAPLAVTDEVSLDLQKLVIDQARADGLDERFLRGHAAPVVEAMCARGRLGRKAGGGFYETRDDGSRRLWPGLGEMYPSRAAQPSAADVGKRLLYVQALESLRCLSEGVIGDAATADTGSVLGIGYPPWTGGALSVIATVGGEAFLADCARFAAEAGPRFAGDAEAVRALVGIDGRRRAAE